MQRRAERHPKRKRAFQALRHESGRTNRVRLQVQRQLKVDLVMLFRTLQDVEQLVRGDPFRAYAKQRRLKLYVAFLADAPRSRVVFPLRSPTEHLEAIARRDREIFIVSGRKRSGFYGVPNNFM